MGMDWGLGIAVTLSGLLVVFAALLLLVAICWVMGRAFRAMSDKKKGGDEKAEKKLGKSAPKAAAAKAAPAQPETGITDEIAAAISGAIACVLGPDRPFAIRSIRRAGTTGRAGRSAWNAAGIAESTRPF